MYTIANDMIDTGIWTMYSGKPYSTIPMGNYAIQAHTEALWLADGGIGHVGRGQGRSQATEAQGGPAESVRQEAKPPIPGGAII